MGIYLDCASDTDASKRYILTQIPSLELASGDALPSNGRVLLCLVHNGVFNSLAIAYDERERREFKATCRRREFYSALLSDLQPFLQPRHWEELNK